MSMVVLRLHVIGDISMYMFVGIFSTRKYVYLHDFYGYRLLLDVSRHLCLIYRKQHIVLVMNEVIYISYIIIPVLNK